MPPAESSFDEVEMLEPQARGQRPRCTQPGLFSRDPERPLVQYGPDGFPLIPAEGDLLSRNKPGPASRDGEFVGLLARARSHIASTAIRRVAERQMAETAT